MKSGTLGFILGFMTYVVLNRVFSIDNLVLEVGIVAAVAVILYVGSKLVERSKRQKS